MAHTSSKEWLNTNLSRAFPFAESTGGSSKALPSSFLVNGFLLYDCSALGEKVVIDSAFVHCVKCDDQGVRIGITCKASTNEEYPFDDLLFISYGSERNAGIPFMSESNGVILSGKFIVGDARVMERYSGVYELDSSSGELCPSILHDISGLYVSALKVGDVYLTGEVELISGAGIEFSANEETNTLTITNTKYDIGKSTITNDEQLLEAAVKDFGTPIKKINGEYPDADGNFSFIGSTSSLAGYDSIIVSETGNGTVTLELKKDPCVDDDTIDTLSTKLEQLNERCSRINSSQLALDTAVNNLATQLTRIN